jgi:hypothetical protein
MAKGEEGFNVSSPYRTGRKSEMLDALPIVCELAQDVLTPPELDEANEISKMLAGSRGQRMQAIALLMKLVAPPPKRPLYYAQHEMGALPHWTRDAIRDLGDYIDLLVKAMTFELSKDHGSKERSLGINLRILKTKKYGISPILLDQLTRYNSFLYQPGKHDFRVPYGRRHRFTSKEVVLTAFITMKLADEIKKLSDFVTQVSLNRIDIDELGKT